MNQTMLLVGGQHGAARVVLSDVSLRPALGLARFVFNFEIGTKNQSIAGCPVWIGGSVERQAPNGIREHLGDLQSTNQPLIMPSMGQEHGFQLTLNLSDRQLQLIEERRGATSVQLWITLNGHAVEEGGRYVQVADSQINYQLNQSEWLSLLEQAGLGRRFLLEIDAPNPQTHPELAEAINYYMQALHRFNEGEWRLTVESLRQSLAAVVGKKADEEDSEQDIQGAVKALRNASRGSVVAYDQRMELVRQAAKFMCDLGAHPEVAETRREHAYGALVMVGGLLHAFSRAN
jgi:hypothetical protein